MATEAVEEIVPRPRKIGGERERPVGILCDPREEAGQQSRGLCLGHAGPRRDDSLLEFSKLGFDKFDVNGRQSFPFEVAVRPHNIERRQKPVPARARHQSLESLIMMSDKVAYLAHAFASAAAIACEEEQAR